MKNARLDMAVYLVPFCLLCIPLVRAEAASEMRVATFRCGITPPLGQPMIGCDLLRTVEEPLLAKGIVIEAGTERFVLCALDWCELCNGAYDSLRGTIAEAAGTSLSHVAVQTLHQHTAPLVDTDALRLLVGINAAKGTHIDLEVFHTIEQRLSASVKQSLESLESFDRIGTGQAKIVRVASSRRCRDETGKIRIRWSGSGADPAMRALPEGKIDPYLKTITLAKGGKPLVRLHYYATHPQTRYRDGRASSDVVGVARERLERKEGVFQVYFTGCAGDITMGKYNDGSDQCRNALASRLLDGMDAAIAATEFAPVGEIHWRTYPVTFPRRTDPGFSREDALAHMMDSKRLPEHRLYGGAVRAAFHQRSGKPIELTSLQLGAIYIVHLPGEPLINYQLYAQGLRPTDFVAVAGYGDCGTGYLCPASAYAEGGYEPTSTSVQPASETLLQQAIAALLGCE